MIYVYKAHDPRVIEVANAADARLEGDWLNLYSERGAIIERFSRSEVMLYSRQLYPYMANPKSLAVLFPT
jgi:hypothetical protein